MSRWTPDPRSWTGVRAGVAWGTLAAALFLGFLAIWVATPARAYAVLPFGVAVPERSPVSCGIAMGVALARRCTPLGLTLD